MSYPELYINTDGGSRGNPGPAALGVYVSTPEGQLVHEIEQYLGVGTNNEAEYQAILVSLRWLLDWPELASVQKITWRLDSKLVVEQLNRRWKIKEARLATFAQECWQLRAKLACSTAIVYVPRAENHQADRLVNQALDAAAHQ